MTIQWFPGHMSKALRLVEERLKFVDIVFELLYARVPYSSSNPKVGKIVSNKPRLIILNKANMADRRGGRRVGSREEVPRPGTLCPVRQGHDHRQRNKARSFQESGS